MRIPCPVLEAHNRVLYPRRQSEPPTFSSSIWTRVSRVDLSEIALFAPVSPGARGNTDTSSGAIRMTGTRTTVTSDRLLEEVPHPWTRLQLILVISVRCKHLLLWREEGARVHGMAVRSAQPADVCAPVG